MTETRDTLDLDRIRELLASEKAIDDARQLAVQMCEEVYRLRDRLRVLRERQHRAWGLVGVVCGEMEAPGPAKYWSRKQLLKHIADWAARIRSAREEARGG